MWVKAPVGMNREGGNQGLVTVSSSNPEDLLKLWGLSEYIEILVNKEGGIR